MTTIMNTLFLKTSPLLACALLAACTSTSGPKPESAAGEARKANTQTEALAELIDITRAGMPRRYRADRDTDVQDAVQAWAKAAGLTLQWQSSHRPMTSGAIDEIEIRAALMSLAVQFRSDQASVIFEFMNPKILRVSDVKAVDQACANVPAGAIALGKSCVGEQASAQSPSPATQTTAPTMPARTTQGDIQAPAEKSKQGPVTTATTPQKQGDHGTNATAQKLSISSGQRLSVALRDWLKSQQFELVWDVTAPGDRIRDIEMISPWSSPTDDLDKTLSLLLPNFGLRAIVQTDPHTVIVRVATGSTSKTTGAQSK